MAVDPARLDELFAAALAELDANARAAFLDQSCAGDPELRERLNTLLAAHDAAGSFLQLPEPDEATLPIDPLNERPGNVVGPYKLLQQIGEGGMGVVFMAEQTKPIQRTVALKIIKPGMDTRQVIARFEAERQALALMDHPNIARVLDAGITDSGHPYFVMELVKGMPITQYCDDHRVTPRRRLELFSSVCQAVQHAHQKGIIHRDLKPSNVMIALYDGRPVPKIIDFGVAKATGSKLTERTLFTEFGAILGTLEYMSPEQAELNQLDVDTRSDIYSLGVLLYELLTGSTPLERKRTKAIALHEVLRVIREEEPPKPSTRLSTAEGLPSIAANRGMEPTKLSGLVRGELDWIVMKALEKDRNRRYETANGFAADVQRYLADEAVQACPPSTAYRCRKFFQRNKRSVMAASVILLTLIAGIIGTTIGLIRVEKARQAEAEQRYLAQASERRAIAAATAENMLRDQVAINLFQRAYVEHSAGRIAEGIALLSRSYELARLNNDLRKSIRTLIAGWAEQGGRPIVQNGTVLAAAFSPDGKTILIGGHDPQCRASFWDASSLSPIGEPLRPEGAVRAVAFSPDGSRAMTGSQDGTAALWNTQSRMSVGEPIQHAQKPSKLQVLAIAFGRDGTVATGGADGMARLWQTPVGDPFGAPLQHKDSVSSVAFHPDGHAVLTGCYDGTAQLWGLESHERLGAPIRVSEQPVYAARFSPDGSKILTGDANEKAQLWDSKTGQLIGELVGHTKEVYSVAFSPDGRRILTGSHDDTAQLWDARTLKRMGPPLRHGGIVMCVDFSPDGRTLITGGADRSVRLWDVSDSDGRILRHQGKIVGMSFSSSGNLVMTIGDDRAARVWDAHTAQPLGKPMVHDASIQTLAISPDGKTLVTGSTDQVFRWNAQSGERLSEPWKFNGDVRKVDFSADGTTLLVQCVNDTLQTIELRDYPSGDARSKPLDFDANSVLLASSSDKQSIVMGHREGPMVSTAQIWNFQSRQAPQHSLQHEALVRAAAFSRDGRYVVTGGRDQCVRVWDARTGLEKFVYQHNGVVRAVTISGDGSTILSGSEDKTARVWDARTNLALLSPLQHADRVSKVAITPDGRLAITICDDGSACVWDVFSCKPVTQPMQFEVGITDCEIRPDGSAILFRCVDGSARLYDIPRPVPDKPELIHAWSLAHSGLQVDDRFEPRPLSQAEWLNAQKEVRTLENIGTADSVR